MRKHEKRTSAFTLIELLIVVAIIGVLAVLAIPRFRDAMTKACVARVVGDCQALKGGIYRYKMDQGQYPVMFNTFENRKGHACEVNLRELTTPTAYLTNVNVRDPFAERGDYTGGLPGGGRGLRADVQHYLYFSYEETDRETGGYTWMSNVMGKGVTKEDYHSAFTLTCWGPDYYQDAAEWIEVGISRGGNWNDKNRWKKIYDPSNGLRSGGDVITPGGNYRFRHYRY